MQQLHRLLFVFFLFAFVLSAQAQDGTPLAAADAPAPMARNSVYLELGGNGLLYTLNYDRLFTDHISGRVGAMVLSGTFEDNVERHSGTGVLIPVMANYLVGSGTNRLELGVGTFISAGSFDQTYIGNGPIEYDRRASGIGLGGVTTTIAYRRQPVDGGFNFRVALTPFYTSELHGPWAGISFGYSF